MRREGRRGKGEREEESNTTMSKHKVNEKKGKERGNRRKENEEKM